MDADKDKGLGENREYRHIEVNESFCSIQVPSGKEWTGKAINEVEEIDGNPLIAKLRLNKGARIADCIPLLDSTEMKRFEQVEIGINIEDLMRELYELSESQNTFSALGKMNCDTTEIVISIIFSISGLETETTGNTFKEIIEIIKSLDANRIAHNITLVIDSDICSMTDIIKEIIRQHMTKHIVLRLHGSDDISDDISDNIPGDTGQRHIGYRISLMEKEFKESIKAIIESGITLRLENFPLCYIDGYEEYSVEARHFLGTRRQIGNGMEYRQNANQSTVDECKRCKLNGICIGFDREYVISKGTDEIFRSFGDAGIIKERIDLVCPEHTDNTSYFRNHIQDDLSLFKYSISLKSNKNNIYDTHNSYMYDEAYNAYSKDVVIGFWKLLLERIEEGKEQNNIGLYINFPFCISPCDYCIYPSTRFKDKKQTDAYIDFLISEIESYSPLFMKIKMKNLSIGGGTPSLMTEDQMERLFTSIFKNFSFDENAEKGIEFNPNSTTPGKIRTIDKFGFNRLSIGVQSLSSSVLKENNRGYQTFENIKKVVDEFRKTGIEAINMDMLIGLKNDTPEDFIRTLDELLRLKPSSLFVYPLKTNDDFFKTRNISKEEFFRFYYKLFDDVSRLVPAIMKKHGYASNMDLSKLSYVHPFNLHPENTVGRPYELSYSCFKIIPNSNLGIGFYSISNINDIVNYIFIPEKESSRRSFIKEFSDNPGDYIYRINCFKENYSKVKFISSNISHSFHIDLKKFREMFNSDLRDDFPYAIKALESLNMITIEDDKVKFNAKSELEIYPYLLFFVGKANVIQNTLQQITRIINDENRIET